MNCRHCRALVSLPFLDLGFAPPSNAYLSASALTQPEHYFPLKLLVCETCWLVQTEDYTARETLFAADYAYFSSVSKSWSEHARRYAESITVDVGLDSGSFVVEVASNDGYLLRHFVAAGVPCLGIEPTASTAHAARAIGVPVQQDFFGTALARSLALRGKQADLIIGNNVLAHVPDVNDFTMGLKTLLKPEGTITLEFPHFVRLLDEGQFDTVYHEHFSYFSLTSVERIFAAAGLRIFRVESLSTHGGSLRVYGCHADDARADHGSVAEVRDAEHARGITRRVTYAGFQARVDAMKNGLLRFLLDAKADGKRVAAYGAAAKGNTLLNYAGVKSDLLSVVADAAPSKQNKFMPGSHIPIVSPETLAMSKPDIVVILPWNLADEIMAQWAGTFDAGTRFAVALPDIRFLH